MTQLSEDFNANYYRAKLKRAEAIMMFAIENGWTEEELRQAVEILDTMIDQ